ncbi:MAG TPA: hypothetical protein PK802_03055 [Candidatus Cloacimonadota bacterium]|nr:hypothetical protein [Candidatus Cloacimonadota bacterium]HOG30723.1 hypothetical protein [Candidatus Cloacimonadota bacterium]HOR59049.1 hypothetical protein [Candidatus Cloacimonadota bacterium]HPB08651.1 hypothetical protein [Candidatus Cloacimonadota bacterium]HPL23041.1 hypothetical protein [Candidatus Cloacimonadota bacterium]
MLRRMTVKAILLVLFGILIVHTVSAEIRVYIDEPSYNLSYFEPVTLAVKVEGLTAQEALRGFKVHLDFDETFLEIADTSAFQEGPFLSSFGPTQWYALEADQGYIITCSILGYTPGATGSGTLFTVDLKAKNQSTGTAGTDVTLSDIILRDPLNQNLLFSSTDCNIVINPGVMIYVEPAQEHIYYYDQVTLAVKIEGSQDVSLRGYQIHLDFDDTYLETAGISAFQEGPFLSSVGSTQWYVLEADEGYIISCAILGYTPGAFGSGTLFYVTLRAKDQSTGPQGTDVTLSDIVLREPLNYKINYISQDGNIVIEPPPYIYTGLKVFLQGPYVTGGSMTHILSDNGYLPLTSPYDANLTLDAFPDVSPRHIVDWITVQLRPSLTGAEEQLQNCFLLDDGTVVGLTGNPALAFDYSGSLEYYLIVRHRNHLEVMSANPATFSCNLLTVSVADLTVLDSVYGGNLFGVNQIEPGVLALYSGDANQDGVIAASDSNYHWRVQAGLLYGYYVSDFNLDDSVIPSDLNYYWRPNSGKLSQIP